MPGPPALIQAGVYLASFLAHATAVQRAAAACGIQASISLQDFSLQLQAGSQLQRCRPKFIVRLDERMAYTDQPSQGTTTGFAGWTPYGLRRWPTASDKVTFKQSAAQRGIRTPAACIDPARIGGPFLIKQTGGSFGEGQRGPFLAYDPLAPEQQLADGEFYENFLPGCIAKAWCWGESCVALELQQPTIVTGNGQSTLRALVEALPRSAAEPDWPLVARLAGYTGVLALDQPVPAGREVLVEYRYGSRHTDPAQRSINQLDPARRTGLAAQFDRAAQLLQDTIPRHADGPARSLFTLDAIVDAEGTAWFLEMNCNPLVHPDAYAPMLADLAAVAR